MIATRKQYLAAPVAIATAFTLTACSDDSAGPEAGTSVEDVAESDPDENDPGAELLGQTVTVSGEIDEIVDETAFRIGGDGLGGDSVLVVSSTPAFADLGIELTQDLADEDRVLQVTGTVREFVEEDLEEELDVDYDDELYEEFEGQNVIVADQVATLPGESLTIAGEVQGVLSTVAFQLAGAGWNVVVLDAEQAAVDTGEYVQVQGTVRQFDIAELEEEFGMDLDDGVYSVYEGDLVLVAENVTPAEAVTPTPAPEG
ncbi:hypothetical protein [Actinotalea sp. Marseille-Q4924]|uniref:hypothetical protein n=1 Tax=Actinotalea sp. Marseille-Q4924 TaxID=2866571 RepID=UPI001CE446F8|nr:hypothetical protein [Actinotalea sp. Marseille-Q4924]